MVDGTGMTMDNGMPTGSEWLPESRAAFVRAKDELIMAVHRHADFYANAEKESSFHTATDLNEDLLNAAIAYAEAQAALSGNALPFNDLAPWQ